MRVTLGTNHGAASSLKGAPLERAQELVQWDLGADTWDEWLVVEGKAGGRYRSKGRDSMRGSSQGEK